MCKQNKWTKYTFKFNMPNSKLIIFPSQILLFPSHRPTPGICYSVTWSTICWVIQAEKWGTLDPTLPLPENLHIITNSAKLPPKSNLHSFPSSNSIPSLCLLFQKMVPPTIQVLTGRSLVTIPDSLFLTPSVLSLPQSIQQSITMFCCVSFL